MFFAWLLVKLIAPRVCVRATNEGCSFEWATDTLYYDRADDPEDVGFLRHIREKHTFESPERFSNRLWSILHELGHYFNPDEDEDLEAKVLCALLPYETATENRIVQDLYYDSPDEFAATEWACAWIEAHPRLSALFSALL